MAHIQSLEHVLKLVGHEKPRTIEQTIAIVAVTGAIFLILELVFMVVLKPIIYSLVSRNPKLEKQGKTSAAMQSIPRAICMLHNLIQVPIAMMVLMDPDFQANPISHASQLSQLMALISAGYFLYDTIECIMRIEAEGVSFLAHGLGCFIVYTSIVRTGQLHFFGAGFILWELSTPFLHARWLLYKMGLGSLPIYTYVSLGMMAAFFGCRIVWGPILSYMFVTASVKATVENPASMGGAEFRTVYYVLLACLNGLNMFWFSKMVKAALDLMKPADKKKQ